MLNLQGMFIQNSLINIQWRNNPLVIPVSPALILYGTAWESYYIEKRNTLNETNAWQFVARVPLTNGFQIVSPNLPPNTAYRVHPFIADPPILDTYGAKQMGFGIVLYGAPLKNYAICSSTNLDIPLSNWLPQITTGTMTNSFRVLEPISPSGSANFYRAQEL